MDLESPAAFFRRLVARRPPPVEDPADMGTVFGLEASLGPVSAYFATEDRRVEDGETSFEAPMNWLARRLGRHR